MQINVETEFGASPEEVIAALSAPEYLQDVTDRVSLLQSAEVEADETVGNQRTIAVRFVAPTRLPAILKKYEDRAPSTVSWVETTRWNLDDLTATLDVTPDVPPHWESKYESAGSIALRPTPQGCRLTQSIEFRLNFGLVGRAIEKLLKSEVETLLRSRLDVLRERLGKMSA